MLAALAIAGCKSKKKPRDAAVSAKPVEAAGDAAPARKPTLVRREAVRELLRAWLEAQNRGDFAAYSALYTAGFRGVRRTGERRVALDRAGWLADRKRMFRNPMVVTTRDVQIAVGPKSAEVQLIQDWSSGSFRDVGPKILGVVETGGKLAIAREEMLRSTVVGTGTLPVASARLALVYNGAVVIADNPELSWGLDPARLVSGTPLVTQPKHCTEDPPDYEAEASRFWECDGADPRNVTGKYVADQALDPSPAGALLRHWRGKKVALYNAAGVVCDAAVTDLRVWAEIETTQDQITGPGGLGTSKAEIAEQVIADSNPIILGHLRPPCPGALYARDPDLEPPPAWAIEPATGALGAAIIADLESMSASETFDADGNTPAIIARVLEPPEPGGRRFAFAARSGAQSCRSTIRVAAVWEIKGGELELVGEADRLTPLKAAADTDGDGAPELIFANGFLVWRGDGYAEIRPVDFPDLVQPCLCECE